MKKILSAILKWLLINGFVAACFYHGITYHNGLASLAQLITWAVFFQAFLSVLIFLGEREEAKKRRMELIASRKGNWCLPAWINLGYDLVLAAFLAYHSFVFTAAALLGAYFCVSILRHKLKEDEAAASSSL